MQFPFYGAVCLGSALALAASAPHQNPAGQGSDMATRLAGTWKGHRTTWISSRPEAFTMVWRAARDGHMTGTVAVAGQPKYPVTVVWSSDTAFIAESAPHMSHTLHEKVVTRSTVRFKGDSLAGTFEARPTTWGAKTVTGKLVATRASAA